MSAEFRLEVCDFWIQGVEKSMDTNKARAAMKKLLEAREQDAQISRKRCGIRIRQCSTRFGVGAGQPASQPADHSLGIV